MPGSGCSPIARGDVRTDYFLVEAKVTEGKSFSLRVYHKNGWAPIEEKAAKTAKEPVMVIEVDGRRLAIVDFEFFQAARQCYERNGGRFPDG